MPANQTSPRNNRLWQALLLVHLAAALVISVLLVREMQAVPMPGLHLAEGERMKCVSYAPYRLPGQTPFDPTLQISREQIAADLTALARITECVRIYSVDQGLELVPELARAVGLKVLLGAWINADPKRNMQQLDRAIQLANDNADVVRVLIVGNEVLLRRERTESELRELLEYARARVKVPLTYADVWEFWMKHPALAANVDWVTVHILPFWEDNPVAIDNAVQHVNEVIDEVAQHFDKPLMIGETGWPSAGRQRDGSQPSLVNQARYIREFVHLAHAKGWNYNLIEAIDQPWKRRLEGTVGGYWGMLDTDLNPKFPLAGPVAERNTLTPPLIAAGVGALLCLLLSAHTGMRTARAVANATAGAVAGLIIMLQFEHAQLAYRDTFEWLVLGTVTVLAALIPVAIARWHGTSPIPDAAAAWRSLREGGFSALDNPTCLALLRAALLFAAAIAALLLFADPRYRDFPTLLYLVPALSLSVAAWFSASRLGAEERICALVIVVAVIGRWLTEPTNPQAVAWLITGLLFATPNLRTTGKND